MNDLTLGLFVASAGLLWYLHQRRSRSAAGGANEPLLMVGRPLFRSPFTWNVLFFHTFIGLDAALNLSQGSRLESALRMLVLAGMVAGIAEIVWRAWRGEQFVDAIFDTEGVQFSAGAATADERLPWAQIRRWSWIQAGGLRLNLFGNGAVYAIPVRAEQRAVVEQFLLARTPSSADSAIAPLPGT